MNEYSLLAVVSKEDAGALVEAATAALEAFDPPHGLRVSDPHLTIEPRFEAPDMRGAAFVGGYADVRDRTASLGEAYFWPGKSNATVLAVKAHCPWLDRERGRALNAVEMVNGRTVERGVDPHITLVRTNDPQDGSLTMPNKSLMKAAGAVRHLENEQITFSRAVVR